MHSFGSPRVISTTWEIIWKSFQACPFQNLVNEILRDLVLLTFKGPNSSIVLSLIMFFSVSLKSSKQFFLPLDVFWQDLIFQKTLRDHLVLSILPPWTKRVKITNLIFISNRQSWNLSGWSVNNECSDAGRWEKLGVQSSKGWSESVPPVVIGLTNLPNIGGASGPLAFPVPASLEWHQFLEINKFVLSQFIFVTFNWNFQSAQMISSVSRKSSSRSGVAGDRTAQGIVFQAVAETWDCCGTFARNPNHLW